MMGSSQKHLKQHAAGRRIAVVIIAVAMAAAALGLTGYSRVKAQESMGYQVQITDPSTGKTVSLYTDTAKTPAEIRTDLASYVKETGSGVESVDVSSREGIRTDSEKTEAGNGTVYSYTEFLKQIVDNHYIDITTVENYQKTDLLQYRKRTVKTDSLRKTTKKVKGGVYGKRVTSYRLVKKNGATASSEKLSTELVQKPKTKVTYVGTGSVRSRRGYLVRGTSGYKVVDFATNWIGNPYRWGGTSLKHGADCSGFVYSVYRHFGVNLPRVGQSAVGKRVSLRNLKPGDELHYPGHVAIYAGNGMVVHAVNPRIGIRMTSMYYTGRPYSATRFVTK
ncbi:MAG: NlpC/P60 family protein [Eubacteriales bacterium]|nr:NlpC/P60 family protein [Eubacteriales bacterium]